MPTAKKTVAPTQAAPAKKAAVADKSAAKLPAGTPKVNAASLVVKKGEKAWTQAEINEVIVELHEQLAHSREVLEAQEAELTGMMRDSGDGAGQDPADIGATTFERDHELTVLNSERDKVLQIERAFSRMEDGTYGVCESCGEPIGKGRLQAFPRATLCMQCKQREERK